MPIPTPEGRVRDGRIARRRGVQANHAEWAAQTQDHRRSRQEILDQGTKEVSSKLQLANETVHMFWYLSSEIVEPFMVPELRARVATTLNAVLTKLTVPQYKELKVSDPAKFNFRPKILLNEVLRTFLNFTRSSEFVNGVVESGFHDPKLFEQTVRASFILLP